MIIFISLAVLLAAVLVIRTVVFRPAETSPVPAGKLDIDEARAVEKLQGAIQIPTISLSDGATDMTKFDGFHRYLEKTFPAVHRNLEKTVINGYSLLYRWKGREESLKPGLIMAHMDVVPVEAGSEGDWTYPPFSGEIAEGYVWGPRRHGYEGPPYFRYGSR